MSTEERDDDKAPEDGDEGASGNVPANDDFDHDPLDEPSAEVAAAFDLGKTPKIRLERRPGEPQFAFQLRRLDTLVGAVEASLLVVFVAVLVLVGAAQSIAGNIFDTTINGSAELIRYSVFFIAMTGAALATQRKRLISMDIFSRMLGPRRRAMLRIVLAMFTIAMLLLFVRGAWDLYQIAKGEHHILIPRSIGVFFLPAGAAVMAFHILLHAIIDTAYLMAGEQAPEEELSAH